MKIILTIKEKWNDWSCKEHFYVLENQNDKTDLIINLNDYNNSMKIAHINYDMYYSEFNFSEIDTALFCFKQDFDIGDKICIDTINKTIYKIELKNYTDTVKCIISAVRNMIGL